MLANRARRKSTPGVPAQQRHDDAQPARGRPAPAVAHACAPRRGHVTNVNRLVSVGQHDVRSGPVRAGSHTAAWPVTMFTQYIARPSSIEVPTRTRTDTASPLGCHCWHQHQHQHQQQCCAHSAHAARPPATLAAVAAHPWLGQTKAAVGLTLQPGEHVVRPRARGHLRPQARRHARRSSLHRDEVRHRGDSVMRGQSCTRR